MTRTLCDLYGHHPYLHKGGCICRNCTVRLTIVVNSGDVFFGTARQWQDCFFAYECLGQIDEYCEDQGWKLEYREAVLAS